MGNAFERPVMTTAKGLVAPTYVPMTYSQAAAKLANATTPEESQDVELFASVARAYADESQNYEMMVRYTRLYLEARRKTTELVKPYISHGGSSRSHAMTLSDFSITKQEWLWRQKEYEMPETKMNEYFDQCISSHWNPSVRGALKFAGMLDGNGADEVQKHVNGFASHAEWIAEHRDKLTAAQRSEIEKHASEIVRLAGG